MTEKETKTPTNADKIENIIASIVINSKFPEPDILSVLFPRLLQRESEWPFTVKLIYTIGTLLKKKYHL